MKARAFYLMIGVVLLCAVAASTASDIDNCCFVDRQCRTDQEWVDGYWAFQNNQCHAPASSQPAGGGPAQIDNCCFVDRQCSTDQEWVDGYWAFQNNQCGAPTQSGTQTTPQPTAGVYLPQIDNCCFVDRQCSSDQEWVNGYWAFQRNLCAAPGPSEPIVDQADRVRGALRIEGSARFLERVNAALDLLRARAPEWYAYTVTGYDWILQVPEGTIVRHPTDVRVWLFGQDFPFLGDLIWFAGILVHEACHMHQQRAGLASGAGTGWKSGLVGERECLTRQIEALEVVRPGHSSLPGLRHLLANIDKPEYQWWHGCAYVHHHGDESECD